MALRFVYQPRIQESLSSFRMAWNDHRISTEHRSSPLQLWTTGMLRNRSSYQAVNEIFSQESVSKTDTEASSSDSESSVDAVEQLRASINPLSNSNVWGVDLYVEALRIVIAHQT